MADYWTYLEMKTKVKNDTDTQSETFVSDTELLGFFNEAIDEMEKEVHKLNEDYFLSSAPLTLVSGTEEYALPANIYAMKIRGLVYRKGAQVYPIKRLRDWNKLENYEFNKTAQGSYQLYNYLVKNSTAGAPRIVITPLPNESGAFVQVWYIRVANELSVDGDICDIPEAANFIMQYVKCKIYEKEHNPIMQKASADLAEMKANVLTSLSEKTPDNDTEIQPDYSYYTDMV